MNGSVNWMLRLKLTFSHRTLYVNFGNIIFFPLKIAVKFRNLQKFLRLLSRLFTYLCDIHSLKNNSAVGKGNLIFCTGSRDSCTGSGDN